MLKVDNKCHRFTEINTTVTTSFDPEFEVEIFDCPVKRVEVGRDGRDVADVGVVDVSLKQNETLRLGTKLGIGEESCKRFRFAHVERT